MPTEHQPAAQALAQVVRREWPQVVASLVRVTGDLSLAEDAAQDAAVEAMTSWETAIPDRPGAWITTVARRRAIDRIRREATGRRKTELLARLEAWDQRQIQDPVENLTGLDTSLRDDQLRLIFGCCHPTLTTEAQVALTLRSVGGLTTKEIAHAFLLPEATMAQRLVRAKRKIATAAIPFVLPSDADLLDRLEVVHSVLYLIFNEGYAASAGDSHMRSDLFSEAIRLARLLAELVPDDAATLALLALMLSTDARALARTDSQGVPVLLEDQDRSLWDGDMIAEASATLDRSLRLNNHAGNPLQFQAAIAQLHAEARSASETDWHQIQLLYERLQQAHPTPVVDLNHAVAVSMVQSPAAGLALLDTAPLADELVEYHYYHSARADMLGRMGKPEQAAAAYDRALDLTKSEPERTLLERKRARLSQ